jgi:chromate transport protein ChrA
MRKTLQHVLKEYGAVALALYLAIFAIVLVSFWTAIRFGWRPQSVAGGVGAFTAAYLATKLTQPLRIAATVFLTPLVVKAYEHVRGRAPKEREQGTGD